MQRHNYKQRFRPQVLQFEDRLVPAAAPIFEVNYGDFGDFPIPAQSTFLNVNDGLARAFGSIQDGGMDLDYFRIATTAPNQRLWAYVDTGGPAGAGSASRDSVLSLLNGAGAKIDGDDDDGTGNGGNGSEESDRSSVVANALLADPGTYYLKIEEYNNDQVLNPYTLHVRVTSQPVLTTLAQETEPNNTKDEPNPIAATDSSSVRFGTVADWVDRDYFAFQARAGDRVMVALDGDPDRDGVSPDFTRKLFDQSTGSLLVTADSSTTSTALNSAAEGFGYDIPATGLYLVQVDMNGGMGTPGGAYRLLVAGNSHPGSFIFEADSTSTSETAGHAAVTVRRVSGDEGSVSVAYAVTGGIASAGSDYTPVGGTLTFADGETSKTIFIPITTDAYVEGHESIVLTLSNPTNGALLGFRTGTTLTIQDSSTPPLTDVTPIVNVLRSAGKFNALKKRVRQKVTLHNVSGQGLFGPLMLVLDGLPKKVKLRNRTGLTAAGQPYIMVNPGVFGADQTIGLMLTFTSRRRRVNYAPRVLAGNGTI